MFRFSHHHQGAHYLSLLRLLLFLVLLPNAGHGLLILDVSRSHIMTHHIR
jgi:hypothetical protein